MKNIGILVVLFFVAGSVHAEELPLGMLAVKIPEAAVAAVKFRDAGKPKEFLTICGRKAVLIFNGYKWTAFDILMAIGVGALLGYFAVNELMKLGISLASVAGVVWGFGTLLFILLYPFPIFGGSVEGEKLKKTNRPLTHEELRLVLGLRHFTKMSPRTIKLFVSFFIISGGLTLLGIVTNT